ncbi:MAG: malonyl-CoA synthase [Rhizobiaceae bacterium]|nr:malonyl-CoA synthase [Hyphomicrobiales bacterium]NRB28960.1 malonyl-CoA synthase [Rhizobiaceae bacterium]
MTNHLFDGLFGKMYASRDLAVLPYGESWSYGKALDFSGQLANWLVDSGVKPGDRVAVQVPKSLEAALLYVACVRAGAVFLPLNTAYTAAEVSYFVGDSGARLLVCNPKDQDAYQEMAQSLACRLETLGTTGDDGWASGTVVAAAREAETAFANVDRSAEDLAAILYTSGTTGRSKGAMLSHDNLLSNAQALVDLWQFSDQDVLLHALPIFHTHGLFVAINVTLLSGASMIFLPAFKVDDMIAHLPQATTMMGVPTFYTRLLDDDRFTRELVTHMRLFVSGSAPLLAETHVQFEERTGHRVLERYGMTETNMNTSNPYDGERRAGTVGFPLPGTKVRVCDPDSGAECAAEAVGMIEVTGPNVFAGYWNMPEKTASEFKADGYFITGDLGKIDADGYLHIVGRSKDLIISGGLNIYPKEIELVLDEQEGVLESAVIGVPHPDFGEAVVAVLVASGEGLDQDAVGEAIRPHLARFKHPKHIEVVKELPRNTMGKVQKNVLRDQLAGLFAS